MNGVGYAMRMVRGWVNLFGEVISLNKGKKVQLVRQ